MFCFVIGHSTIFFKIITLVPGQSHKVVLEYDCPSVSKVTLNDIHITDIVWIYLQRWYNHHDNKTNHSITACTFHGLYCIYKLFHKLHAQPYGRYLPSARVIQGNCQWPLKTVEITTCHLIPQSIATEVIRTRYLDRSTTEGVMPATQLKAMSHTLLSPNATKLDLCSSLFIYFSTDQELCPVRGDPWWPYRWPTGQW